MSHFWKCLCRRSLKRPVCAPRCALNSSAAHCRRNLMFLVYVRRVCCPTSWRMYCRIINIACSFHPWGKYLTLLSWLNPTSCAMIRLDSNTDDVHACKITFSSFFCSATGLVLSVLYLFSGIHISNTRFVIECMACGPIYASSLWIFPALGYMTV